MVEPLCCAHKLCLTQFFAWVVTSHPAADTSCLIQGQLKIGIKIAIVELLHTRLDFSVARELNNHQKKVEFLFRQRGLHRVRGRNNTTLGDPMWSPIMPKALASGDTRALFVAGAGLEPTTFGL